MGSINQVDSSMILLRHSSTVSTLSTVTRFSPSFTDATPVTTISSPSSNRSPNFVYASGNIGKDRSFSLARRLKRAHGLESFLVYLLSTSETTPHNRKEIFSVSEANCSCERVSTNPPRPERVSTGCPERKNPSNSFSNFNFCKLSISGTSKFPLGP